MTLARADLELLILDLLSPVRDVSQSILDTLSDDDWSTILMLVERQRIGPMMRWALMNKPSVRLPENVGEWLTAEYRGYTMRALETRRTLVFVHDALTRAGLPYVALKGAFLAYYTYPQPGLRPLRDIDVLVPKEAALDVFRLLQAGGASPLDREMSPGSMLELSHQLPPLLSPSQRQVIELHTRLFHVEGGGALRKDPAKDSRFWERTVQVQMHERGICFESVEYLMLHLIFHSVYDHKFNNGPLILSDLAFLIKESEVDWSFFWMLVEEMHCMRGAALVFQMVERYWGITCVDAPPRAAEFSVRDDVLSAASRMMFHDLERSKCARRIADTEDHVSAGGKSRMFFQKIFPSRAVIGKPFPVDPHSSKVFLYYPRYVTNIIANRLPRYILGTERKHVKDELDDIRKLKGWLNG